MLTKEHHHNKFCLATFRKLNKPLKPTVISISMTTVMTGAVISFALGLIAQTFPDASPTMIKLILTAPSLMIIPLSFLSSYLTTIFTKRTIIMWELFIYHRWNRTTTFIQIGRASCRERGYR